MADETRPPLGPLLNVKPGAVTSSHIDPSAVITVAKPTETEFLDAAAKGDCVRIKDLIGKGVSIGAKNNHGETALQLAARNDHTEAVEVLLRYNCESKFVNASDDIGWCALHEASRQGYEDVVKELLKYGAGISIRTKNSGDTALHKACLNGHKGVVQLLLEYGVDVNTRTEIGETPLHIAARNGYEDIVKLLLDKADVTVKDKDGWTPLYSATNFGKEPVIELLLQKMSQIEIVEQTKNGDTAIFRAVQRGDTSIVFLFLKREADLVLPFLEEGADLTGVPIESGVYHASGRDVQMIYDFLTEKMSLDDSLWGRHFLEVGLWAARNNVKGQNTWTLMNVALEKAEDPRNKTELEEKLLYGAAFCGNQVTVHWLLRQQVRESEMEIRNIETSMRLAAWNGHTGLLAHLIKKWASPKEILKKFVNGETLLHLAARSGNDEVLRLLLNNGAEIMAKTEPAEETSLHLAASIGHINVVTEILGRKDKPYGPHLIKARTADGETALSLAARKALSSTDRTEFLIVVELLLDSMTTVDFGGTSDIEVPMLTWAAQKNKTTIVQKLLAKRLDSQTERVARETDRVARATRTEQATWTALDRAAFFGDPIVVWWLLANGAPMHDKSAQRIAEARLDSISANQNPGTKNEGPPAAEEPHNMDTDKARKGDGTGEGRPKDFERVQHDISEVEEDKPEGKLSEDNDAEEGKQQEHDREGDELPEKATPNPSNDQRPLISNLTHSSATCQPDTKEIVAVEESEAKESDAGDKDSMDTAFKIGAEAVVKKKSEAMNDRRGLSAIEDNEEGKDHQTQESKNETSATVLKAPELEHEASSAHVIDSQPPAAVRSSNFSSNLHLDIMKRNHGIAFFGGRKIGLDKSKERRVDEKDKKVKSSTAQQNTITSTRHYQAEYQRHKLTLDILKDPPPVLEQSDSGTLYQEPSISDLREDQIRCCQKFSATIVDFYNKDGCWGLLRRSPKVSEVLYENGVERIMSTARKDLQRINPEAAKKRDYDRKDLQFRWIHLPANNMEWMQDLVRKLYKDRQEEPDDYRTLINFVRRSWYELPASSSKARFMKPACLNERMLSRRKYRKTSLNGEIQVKDGMLEDDSTGDIHGRSENPNSAERGQGREKGGPSKADSSNVGFEQRSSDRIALYMPYLTFATIANECTNTSYGELIEAYKNDVVHGSRTLDQFYYHSLSSTESRDFDQVVTRYIETKAREKWPTDGCTILRVDQLWLWAVDEETIITSSTHRTDGMEDQVIDQICTYLRDQAANAKGRALPTSVDEMSRVIPNFCISFISQSTTRIEKNNASESALQIFRNSINEKAEEEAKLFRKFTENIDQKRDQDRESEWKKLYKETKGHLCRTLRMLGLPMKPPEDGEPGPYESISRAAHLLEEVKDIRDELNILRCLLLHQKTVWDSLNDERFLKNGWRGTKDTIDEIDEMDKAAERIQGSVNSLLDLDQNEVNIVEAQKSSKQGTVVLVFTIVTIAFLPMTFLTSLFALNITSFQHQSGTLMYEPGWIFPLLFGPSTAISVPLIIFAMNVNRMVNMFKPSKPSNSPGSQTQPSPPSYTQSGGQAARGTGNIPWGSTGVRNRLQSSSSGSGTTRVEPDWNQEGK